MISTHLPPVVLHRSPHHSPPQRLVLLHKLLPVIPAKICVSVLWVFPWQPSVTLPYASLYRLKGEGNELCSSCYSFFQEGWDNFLPQKSEHFSAGINIQENIFSFTYCMQISSSYQFSSRGTGPGSNNVNQLPELIESFFLAASVVFDLAKDIVFDFPLTVISIHKEKTFIKESKFQNCHTALL